MRLVYIYAYMSSEKQPQFKFELRKSQKKKEGKLKQGKLTSRFRPIENFKGTETNSENLISYRVSQFPVLPELFAEFICV